MGSGYIIQGTQPGTLGQPRGVGWGQEWEGYSGGGGDICILMTDSHCCMAETKTTM